MTVDLSEFRNRKRGPTCAVLNLLPKLTRQEKAKLEAALADPEIAGSTIARVVRGWGHQIEDQTIRHHRRGDCRCPRS